MENKKLKVSFKEKSLGVAFDGDQDGEASVKLDAHLEEVYQELLDRGEAKIDVKTLSVKMDGGKITLQLDTDRDGEPVLSLMLDGAEGLSEALKQ